MGRKVRQAAGVQDVVGGKSEDFAGGPIDAHPRVHREGVPLDSRLELLVAIVREPDRTAGEEHRRERDIERKWRVVAAAETAAHIGELHVDACRLVRGLGLAEQEGDGLRGVARGLRADDELEVLAACVVPGEAVFRLEKHRIHRLRLELPLQHQARRIVPRKLGANVFAVTRGLRIVLPGGNRQPRPDRALGVLELSGTDPAILDRRIDIRRVGGRPRNPRETIGSVRLPRDRTALLAVFHDSRFAQREARLIEGIEILEDQKCDRLAQIERRSADRAEQVAGVKFGNARADTREIFRGDNDRGFQGAGQARQIEAVIDMRCVGGADEHRVRGLRRPAGQIGGAKIRCVELRSGNLGDAIDAPGSGGRRIPVLPARESFARREVGLLRQSEARNRKRDAARGEQLDEIASRGSHNAHFLESAFRCLRRREPSLHNRFGTKAFWHQAFRHHGQKIAHQGIVVRATIIARQVANARILPKLCA